MGYAIRYSQKTNKKFPTRSKNKVKPIHLFVICSVMIAIFSTLKMDMFCKVRQFFLPGDPEITKAAFGSLIDDIRTGEAVGDAIAVFCREILENADQNS